MILQNLLQNIEIITNIAKLILNYESYYCYPTMVSELLNWTVFYFSSLCQTMTSLLLHKNLYFVQFWGYFQLPPALDILFGCSLTGKLLKNIAIYRYWTDMDIVQFIWKYWKQNCYCKIDLEILNFILILQNLPCNIEIISAIVGIIWNYWSHYDIAKFIWKYWYPYWYCRKPLIILKLVSIF